VGDAVGVAVGVGDAVGTGVDVGAGVNVPCTNPGDGDDELPPPPQAANSAAAATAAQRAATDVRITRSSPLRRLSAQDRRRHDNVRRRRVAV
jgi:hypothetical protein